MQAPVCQNDQIDMMISETNRLAKQFVERGWPLLAFLDLHEPGVPEPPYSTHCERGTGEEEFVPVSVTASLAETHFFQNQLLYVQFEQGRCRPMHGKIRKKEKQGSSATHGQLLFVMSCHSFWDECGEYCA